MKKSHILLGLLLFLIPIFAPKAKADTPQYTITDLSTLPSYHSTNAYDLNDNGQVVGVAWIANGDSSEKAFIWQNGVMTQLPLFSSQDMSIAFGINNNGQVSGDDADHAIIWDN